MFHLLHGIYTNIMSTQPNEQESTIIVPLDQQNALNMESRQHILQHFASAFSITKTQQHGTDGMSYGHTSKPEAWFQAPYSSTA